MFSLEMTFLLSELRWAILLDFDEENLESRDVLPVDS